jgi:hypothetical protein
VTLNTKKPQKLVRRSSMNALIEQFLLDNQLSTNDLRNYCNQVGQEISLIWGIDDVHKANENLNYRLLSD